MDANTFRVLVEGEPDRHIVRVVRPLPRVQGRTLAELRALATDSPAHDSEFDYGHRLGPPVSADQLSEWEARHGVRLPVIARELVANFDGVHLWANLATGRAYSGVAPLAEWVPARDGYFHAREGDRFWSDSLVQISYNADCSDALVLDCNNGEVFRAEVSGPDTDSRVARNLPELLDHLWSIRLAPRGGPGPASTPGNPPG